jgi:serine/threonine protein kinase
MKTENNCPNCSKPLPGDALQGLCPDCLLKAGWPTAAEDGVSGQGFTPPPIEELVRLFPKLEILELIGRGGMGAVFKARQSHLDRMVALKILPIEKGSDPGFAERFSREAQALAKLSHRHIVSVHDFGQVEGFHYFLMEYVDGLNLRQIQQADILAPHEALEIVPQICEALQFAHDNGVVHRDIKPENILLDQTGCIKIADFGLAKILGTERTNFTLTEPNHVMGTPHYMAPEQVEHPRDVDHRADIYSLGVVFYELLTGELPLGKFAAPSKKVQVDVRLDDVVLRSLEKEPELRYQQVSEVGTEVQTIATGQRTEDGGRRTEGKSRYDFHRILRRLWYLLLIIGLLSIVSYIMPGVQRYMSVDRGSATPRYTNDTHHFGPTAEHVFVRVSNNAMIISMVDQDKDEIYFWDLDGNHLIQPPSDVAMPEGMDLFHYLSETSLHGRPELKQWLPESGVDLVFAFVPWPNGGGWQLMGLGADRLDRRLMDPAFAAVKPTHLAERKLSPLKVAGNRIKPGRPKTLYLRTDQGRAGVLEWEGLFDGATDGIRIRYKLLESRQASQDRVSTAPIDPEVLSEPIPKEAVQEDGLVVDINDPGFWGAQIKRHLEAVRTLDAAIETERQVFGEDQQAPEKRYRYRIDLKWDRDNKWIDCSSQQIGESRKERVIQGDEVAWKSHSDRDWTKLKAGSNHMALAQFSYFGEMRKNAYEHAFGVARGIICSHMLHLTQAQGAVDWGQVQFNHHIDDQGRHVLEQVQMTPGLDGEQVEAGMALIGAWEHDAFKLLELRGICRAYDVDLLYEGYTDHVYNQGAWVPRQVTEYDWITPQPGVSRAEAAIRLREKRITKVQRLVVNRTMQAREFDDFRPPAGANVTDAIRDTHYTVWPDLETIRANGGKQRVSINGRVYLDGRPGDRISVSTSTRFDPNDESNKRVHAETDVNGEFTLAGLVPGFTYRIKVKDEAGYTADTTVRLSDQGEDYQGLKIDMASGLTVVGRVTGPDGQPIENALVRFRDKPMVKTDAQGRYAVNGLYADQGYEVEVGAQGYAPLDPGGDVLVENFKIQLDPNGQPLPFDITLEAERILHGQLIDQDGKPVEGVRMRAWSTPFGTGSTWKWYDTYTDPDGRFRIGNLGDRIYAFFVGQYGQAYHNPTESPVVIRVTGDSIMATPLPGRALVTDTTRAQAETYESAYHRFFRLKEFEKQGGKLINQWLEQLADPNVAMQSELLARLGSVPAYQAHDTLEQILGGHILGSSKRVAGTVIHSDSNAGSASDVSSCPTHLVRCQDPTIICLAMRALARSGFVFEHAQLLIDQLDHEREQVRAYALMSLAEMTGVYAGTDKSQWQTWLDHYRDFRSALDTRGNYSLFIGICRVARTHELSPRAVEQVMAAWQGGSVGAFRFRELLNSEQGAAVWQVLAMIRVEGENPIQWGHALGYWRRGLLRRAGHHQHDLKVQFDRPCTLGDKTFEPDRGYVIPALFRDGYQGKWEIADLRLEDIQTVISSQ